MQIAPSSLSVIVAVLSAQGISASGAQIAALLAPLTGEETPQPNDDAQLREGELYLVWDTDDRELNDYSTREALDSAMQHFVDRSLESGYNRELDDMCQVFISRKELTFNMVTTFTIR